VCTTGAKILRPGREFILFKNRDFTREHFDDAISLSARAFGIRGLETWDGDGTQDRFSGFSIGFNAHLACCDSNVRTVPQGDNYDRLVKAVVENCADLDHAVACVRDLVGARLYCWANLLLATAGEVAAVEVRDHHIEVERHPTQIARANHHVCLGATPDDDDTTTTADRYHAANNGLDAISSLDEVFPLLSQHQPGARHSICNHSAYHTVYSYLVHWNDGALTFFVHQGKPCSDGDYVRLPIVFGGENDLSRYPSSRLTSTGSLHS
jgi:hypothetical protein